MPVSRRQAVLGLIAAVIRPKIPQLPAYASASRSYTIVNPFVARGTVFDAMCRFLESNGWTKMPPETEEKEARMLDSKGEWIITMKPTEEGWVNVRTTEPT